jgi:hypothetical protein
VEGLGGSRYIEFEFGPHPSTFGPFGPGPPTKKKKRKLTFCPYRADGLPLILFYIQYLTHHTRVSQLILINFLGKTSFPHADLGQNGPKPRRS